MKKVIAYVNNYKVHLLVQELQKIGIDEIIVTEYFKPRKKISRLELRCGNNWVEQVRNIVHKNGTADNMNDNYFEVKELDDNNESIFPNFYE